MKAKDVPQPQFPPHFCFPVYVQNQQRHSWWLLPGRTKHGVVAGERGWAMGWEGP